MKMVYNWKMNGVFKVDAQKAGEYLSGLAEERKGLQPKDIVEESRDKKALLHPCFDWNDDTAAEKYRIEQAKAIVRSISVTVLDADVPPVRAFLSITEREPDEPGRNRVYMSTRTLMENAETKDEILKQALMELLSFKRKYSHLEVFSTLFDEVEAIQEKLMIAGVGGEDCGERQCVSVS